MNNETQTPEATAVMENQQVIASTKAAIATLQNAISKCDSQITQQQAALPDAGPLLSQRADLLAAIAIGEDKSADMKMLDAKLEKLNEQRNDATPALDVLKQTVEGLRRRLSETRETLQSLQATRSSLMRKFLLSRAETIGAEYFEYAKKMVAQYKQLTALGYLMQGRTPLVMRGEGLNIPRFHLESMPSLMAPVWAQNVIFTNKLLTWEDTLEWMRQETDALHEIGIVVNEDVIPLPVQTSSVASVSAPTEPSPANTTPSPTNLVSGSRKRQGMVFVSPQ